MKSKTRLLMLVVAVFVAASLLAGVYMYFGSEKEAQAQNVVSYQTTTLEDGTNGYTETTYSSALLVGYYGLVQVHAVATVSGTTTFTVTPQFSNEPVSCASVDATTGWFTATEYVSYVQQTVTISSTGGSTATISSTVTSNVVTEGSVTVRLVLASDAVGGREALALGRCFRVKMEAAALFTPTVYARRVNRQ